MPALLKRDTIRLFESSLEALQLAITGLGLSRRDSPRDDRSRFSAHIGLLGASVEQALCACLVQGQGASSLMLPGRTGQFKPAALILDECLKYLKAPPSGFAQFMFDGVADRESHQKALTSSITAFRTLMTQRALGLHAGQGPNRDVCLIVAADIIAFLHLLSSSRKIRPYVTVPDLPTPPQDRMIVLEQLRHEMSQVSTTEDLTRVTTSYCVILPTEIASELGSEIPTLSAVSSPEDFDILVRKLSHAIPVRGRQSGDAATTYPVRFATQGEPAIPINVVDMRKTFTRASEQWAAYIATANGELDKGRFSPPPVEFVRQAFADFDSMSVCMPLTCHDAWPFIAASMGTQGAAGPLWFLVRKTAELGELPAALRRVPEKAGAVTTRYRGRLERVIAAIQLIAKGETYKGPEIASAAKELQERNSERQKLVERAERQEGQPRALFFDGWQKLIAEIAVGDRPVGHGLQLLLDGRLSTGAGVKYWSRILCEASSDEQDVPALVKVLSMNTEDYTGSHSAAKKALRLIDLLNYGPAVDIKTVP